MKKTIQLFMVVIFIITAMFVTAGEIKAAATSTFWVDYPNGIQQAQDTDRNTKYNNWYGWFSTTSGANGYRRVRYPEGGAAPCTGGDITVSEGVGYGMLLAVWYGDQTFFNELWNYKTTVSPRLGLMGWCVNSSGVVVDQNSATDADVDIAMALLLAHRRWGSGGAINYGALATTEINKVASSDICAVAGTDQYFLYPGDYCSCVSGDNTYPSYFTPAWYTEFGLHTGNTAFWAGVKTKAATLLAVGRNTSSGLDTEQITRTGARSGTTDGYNSARIPWRYSLDYIWNGTAASLTQITLNASFFTGKASTCGAVYNVADNSVADSTHNGMRVGGAACSMMITGKATELGLYFTAASTTYNDPSYFYNSSLALLALIQMTGNCPNNFGPTQTPVNTPGGDLFDDCEDADNQNQWGGFWYTYFDRGPLNYGTSYVVPNPVSWYTMAAMVPTPFWMQAATGMGGAYAARMTGVVTTVFTYGFVGMGSGTNMNSGRMTFEAKDCSMYTGIRFKMKAGTSTDMYDFKVTCPKSVTNTGDNDWKYTFTGTTAMSVITIPFTAFTQAVGWGIPTSFPLVYSNMTDLQWQTNGQPKPYIDLWVDDIEFYPAQPPTPTPTYCTGEKFDTLSDGDNTNLFGGFWYTYKDTNGSTITPATTVTFTATAPGAGGVDYAARINGSIVNVAASFGGMGSNMTAAGTARDMHLFVGISFWAQGDGNYYSVKLKAMPSINTGNNDYKYTFKPPTGSWAQMTIPFSIFTQEGGWGYVVALNTVLTLLKEIQFETKGINHTYSLWIDDIVFNCSQNWTPTRTPNAGTQTFTPTSTRTPTYTRTRTATLPANTSTFTRTPTGTFTRTVTNTPTFTRTNTLPANTSTYTRTPTGTFSRTVTGTPTFTRTNTMPANTFTFTSTRTPTFTRTNTNTPGDTATYTFTRTGTPTYTNTVPPATSTFTITRTNSRTPSYTRTQTPVVSNTDSPTISPTAQGSFTITPTITRTWTMSASPTRTATPTFTATRTYTETLQPTATRTATGTTIINTATNTQVIPTLTNTQVNTATRTATNTQVPPTITNTTIIAATPTYTQTTGGTPDAGLLDDLSDCDTENLWGGYWYSFADAGSTSTYTSDTPGYEGAGDCAARLQGTVGAGGYAVMGTQLNANAGTGTTTDISSCTGISFYAYGDGGTYFMRIPYTDASGGSLTGWDDYSYTFTPPAGVWTLVTIPFTAFTQAGWGVIVPIETVLAGAKELHFRSETAGAVDLWVDDVTIYGCAASPTPTPNTGMLDDLADCDTENMWGGYWYSFADAGSTSTYTSDTPGYEGAGDCAARLQGTVGAGGYAVMGTQLNANAGTGVTTDISFCTGIQFYAFGDGGSYFMRIPYTDASGGSLTGWDDYSYTFTPPAGVWTLVTIPFTAFTQAGWGVIVPISTVLAGAKELHFRSETAGAVDLWVDNVEIYGCVLPSPTPTYTEVFTLTNTPLPTNTNTIIPTETNTLMPTSTRTPTPTFTYTVVQSATFTPTTVPGGSILTGIIAPAIGVVGQQVTIIMAVFNNGTVAIDNISASALTVNVPAALSLVSSPSAAIASLAPAAGDAFTWVYDVVSASPSVTLSGNASGFNSITAAPVSSAVTLSVPSMACVNPTATFTATPTVTPTWTSTFTLTVTPSRTVTPTFTWTASPTSQNTATFTRTMTATPTRTVIPTSTPATQAVNNIVSYPNPVNPATGGILFNFDLNRMDYESIGVKIFTASSRLVRNTSFTKGNLNIINNRTLYYNADYLSGLSSGVYYYYLYAKKGGEITRSKIEKIIIIK